jgi:enterochelin esterase family protein
VLFALPLALGCSSTPRADGNTGGAGSATTTSSTAGNGGMGGAANAGGDSIGGSASSSAGVNASSAGTSGSSGGGTATAGSGGTALAGSAGSANTAGANAAGNAGGPGVTTGIQSDPGTAGDGKEEQLPPYVLKPESTMQVNGAPKGQLLGPTIYSQTGTYTGWDKWKFTYWVYVPAQYKPGHPAALMIFQDGLKYNGDQVATPARFNTPTVFDNLIAEGSMPVTIGLFIDPGTNDGHHVGGGDGGRSRQYDTANDQYGKFLLTELIPSEITSKYDIVTDADGWAIGGHSSGGNASVTAAWFYPDKLHKVLTASASLPLTGGKFPGEVLKVTPAKPLRIYHMAGTQDDPGIYDANNQLAENLATMGYHYRYRPGQDVHYPPSAAAADFPDALRWLWRGYKAGL